MDLLSVFNVGCERVVGRVLVFVLALGERIGCAPAVTATIHEGEIKAVAFPVGRSAITDQPTFRLTATLIKFRPVGNVVVADELHAVAI